MLNTPPYGRTLDAAATAKPTEGGEAMRRWNALIFAVSVASIATPLPVLGETGPGHLFSRTDFVRFEIVLGRITAQNACHGKARIATQGDLEAGNGEVLTLRVLEGVPRIRYEMRRDNQSYAVTVIGADRILIERRGADKSLVRYEQQSRGDVKLILNQDGQERILSAPSLWHLWLRHPDLCDLELAPSLKVLRPNWRMDKDVRELEEALFELATDYSSDCDYHKWLAELADDRFKVRQAAFRRFQSAGVGAKAFLERVRTEETGWRAADARPSPQAIVEVHDGRLSSSCGDVAQRGPLGLVRLLK